MIDRISQGVLLIALIVVIAFVYPLAVPIAEMIVDRWKEWF